MPLGASRLLTLANPGAEVSPEAVVRYKQTVTSYGNAQIDTSNYIYGGASGQFDGSGDYLLTPVDQSFWSNAWTIEFWFYVGSTGVLNIIAQTQDSATTESSSCLFRTTNGKIRSFLSSNGSSWDIFNSQYTSDTYTVNSWNHYAVCFDGTNDYRHWLNGVDQGSQTNSSTVNDSGYDNFYIGGAYGSTAWFSGHLDEIRFSSTNRYSSGNFTPSGPFVNDTDTILLIHANGTGVDATTNFVDDNGEARDISLGTYASKSFSVSTFSTPNDVRFGDSGNKMYVCGDTADEVRQYNLSTAYDVSTASYANKSVSAGTGTFPSPQGLFFKPDGTKMYVSDAEGVIEEFSLSTAWDVSTASGGTTQSFTSQVTIPRGICMNSDGSKLFIADQIGSEVYQYTLSTPYSITSASYDSKSFDTGFSNYGISINDLGTTITVNGTSNMKRFDLSTANDVSNVTETQSFNGFTTQDFMSGHDFSENGEIMIMSGYDSTDTVYQYNTVES